VDDLGLVKTVDGLGEGVVVAVADTADRRLDPGLGEPLGVSASRAKLAWAVRLARQPTSSHRGAIGSSAMARAVRRCR